MRKISVGAAKAELGALLDAVERGEEITITRRGKPVAKLVRSDPETRLLCAPEAADRLVALRDGVTLGPEMTLRGLIDGGRR